MKSTTTPYSKNDTPDITVPKTGPGTSLPMSTGLTLTTAPLTCHPEGLASASLWRELSRAIAGPHFFFDHQWCASSMSQLLKKHHAAHVTPSDAEQSRPSTRCDIIHFLWSFRRTTLPISSSMSGAHAACSSSKEQRSWSHQLVRKTNSSAKGV